MLKARLPLINVYFTSNNYLVTTAKRSRVCDQLKTSNLSAEHFKKTRSSIGLFHVLALSCGLSSSNRRVKSSTDAMMNPKKRIILST